MKSFFLAALMVACAPAWACAAVLDSAAGGFTVKLEVPLAAPPADVYAKFVHNVGDWWDSSHTFSGDAHNLSLADKAQGCFCEKLAAGGSVRHLEIVRAVPGSLLVLSGGLGPLQTIAAAGAMSVDFHPSAGKTALTLTYTVAGYVPAGMNSWAAPVQEMLSQQLERFKNYVERGDPAKKP